LAKDLIQIDSLLIAFTDIISPECSPKSGSELKTHCKRRTIG